MTQQTDKIKIRKMTERDLPKVIAVERFVVKENPKPIWPFSFESYWEIYNPDVSYVAEIDGKLAGFIVGKIVEPERRRSVFQRWHTGEPYTTPEMIGWVDMIGILPEYQRQGIGRRLLEAFYEECRKKGAVMRSVVYDNNDRFKAVLTDMGFKESNVVIYEKV
jgi:ribosomal protein S18 acetylase RimI-like enzyme